MLMRNQSIMLKADAMFLRPAAIAFSFPVSTNVVSNLYLTIAWHVRGQRARE